MQAPDLWIEKPNGKGGDQNGSIFRHSEDSCTCTASWFAVERDGQALGLGELARF